MKIILSLVSVVIAAVVIVLAFLNVHTLFNFTLSGHNSINLNLAQVILGVFLAGILVGIAWATSFYMQTQVRLKEYQKKLEKTSVISSGDSAKIDVLEAKIATLEKALKSALEQND